MIQFRPTTAHINLNALRHNVTAIQQRLPEGVKIFGIVKANAYGHGAVMCARVLAGMGVTTLGVATLEEGMELRNSGIKGDIYVLGGLLSPSINEFLDFRLKPVIHHLEDLKRFGSFLQQSKKEYGIVLKLDTGMGRLGFFPSQTEEVLELLKKYASIRVEGVMTHLARADEPEQEPTQRQFLLFEKLKKLYVQKGLPALFHIANSAAIIDEQLSGFEMVRPGIMLYGAYPHPRQTSKIDLQPVMSLKTKMISLKKFSPQSPLSYGGTFVTKKESLIGCLPIGYADGYPRLVSNKGFVLIKGRRVPVVGRVCMDLTLIDLSDLSDGSDKLDFFQEEIVLIGKQGDSQIRAEEVANWAETISYEIFCGISARVPRVYEGV